MGEFFSTPSEPEPKTPVKNYLARVKNVFKYHFRGIIGFLVPLIVLPILGGEKDDHARLVQAVWIWMFWFMLLQPVNIPVTAMIPVFMFPMTGTMSTEKTNISYFNQSIALMILAGMTSMLINNCGMDKRIAVKILSYGDVEKFTPNMLLIKCSVTSFILSMLCNRLLSCASIYELILHVYLNEAQDHREISRMRDIIFVAVQTSSVLGSTTIVHNSFQMIACKANAIESRQLKNDVFNYLQFFIFSLPGALVMLILNTVFFICLLKWYIKPKITVEQKSATKAGFEQYQNGLPPITWREKISVAFTIFTFVMYFVRWTQYTHYIWATVGTADACVACFFVIVLHSVPMDLNFLRIFFAKQRKDLPSVKPSSALLWWKYVDRNTNYSYILLIGASVAILKANYGSGLISTIRTNVEPKFDLGWNTSIFLVLLITTILSNMMSGTAVATLILPMIMCFGSTETWKNRIHLGALGVGLASNYGFMCPFRFTPAYQCHKIGKTPLIRMAKYSVACVFICMIILWISLCIYAPAVWKNVEYMVPTELQNITRLVLRTTSQEMYDSDNDSLSSSTQLFYPYSSTVLHLSSYSPYSTPIPTHVLNGTAAIHKMFKYLLNRNATRDNFLNVTTTVSLQRRFFDYETFTFVNETTTQKLYDYSQNVFLNYTIW